MIALVSFDGIERSLFEKAAQELAIDHRIHYFNAVDDLFTHHGAVASEAKSRVYPRVIVMNIDDAACISSMGTLKATGNWDKIPVIGYGFLTEPTHVTDFYGAGGASCIRKPDTYAELVETTRGALGYWLSMTTLPCDFLREA